MKKLRQWNDKKAALYLILLLLIAVITGCGGAPAATDSAQGIGETAQQESAGKETSAASEEQSGSAMSQSEEQPAAETEQTEKQPAAETEQTEEQNDNSTAEQGELSAADAQAAQDLSGAPELTGLVCVGRMAPDYAVTFDVYYYENDYALIDVFGDARYLVIPEDGETPQNLPEDIICLKKPFEDIYMVATAVYSLFDSIDALDRIRFTGTDQGGIYIDAVDEALADGKMIFAGRYSAPDYETLIKDGCDLAIESTRIYHTPEIKEVLESLEIPVFVDRSSFETHPLGRTEWIRVYGLLLGKEEEADAYFEEQVRAIDAISDAAPTGKKVLFFYMNTDGTAVIRRPEDYMVKMIEMAGGEYAFSGYQTNSTLSAVSVSMEEFYSVGKDADIIIYNASVNAPITSIADLTEMDSLFADFKAVEEERVWTTGKSLYQAANITSRFTLDLYEILHDGDDSNLSFLTRVH